MMAKPGLHKKLAVIADNCTLGAPAQQILDRFLIGYTRDGEFQQSTFHDVVVFTNGPRELLEARNSRYGLKIAPSVAEAVREADSVICFSHAALGEVVARVRAATPLFVYGSIAEGAKDADALVRKANDRSIPLCAGTVMSSLMQLPPLEIPSTPGIGAQIREALIVTNGDETDAFEAVAAILDQHGDLKDVQKVRTLEGADVWRAADEQWSRRLLAAALSRTDNAQGNTELDGRTEEIVESRLVEKMAQKPRGRIVEHGGGLRTTVLVLDGVVSDLVVAVKAGRRLLPGAIYSTQLFQSPKPQQEEFSRLVAVMNDLFASSKAPWSLKRAAAVRAFAEKLRK